LDFKPKTKTEGLSRQLENYPDVNSAEKMLSGEMLKACQTLRENIWEILLEMHFTSRE